MVVFPNAKINLGLNIVSKRPDGFHNLESCFYPVPWTDALEVLPSEEFSFTSTGIPIPGDLDKNLCVSAFKLLRDSYNLPPVKIHLHKNIPIGAGMGGGSSDAAYTIKVINEIFNLKLSDIVMEDFARQLGSDCAFFIRNKPILAVEKGDVFEELQVSLKGKNLLIVYPEIHISTKEAYDGVVPKTSKPIREVISLPIEEWKSKLHNDFEDSLFPKYPELEAVKNILYNAGAMYASMTGSGSAVFGIFDGEETLTNSFPHGTFRVFKL